MYYLILFIPLLSAITAGLFGRKIGEKGAGIITTGSIIVTSIMS
jgi:NADH-quinone oxidoreductase subunit L